MTIKEALVAELDTVDVSDATLEKVLTDRALFSFGVYSAADHARLIDMAAIDVLRKALGRANVSEGGYSVSWNADSLRLRIAGYYSKWGMLDPDIDVSADLVTDISYKW